MRKLILTAASILALGGVSVLAVVYLQPGGPPVSKAVHAPEPAPAVAPAPNAPPPDSPRLDLSRYAGSPRGDGRPGIIVPPKPMQYAPAPPRAPVGTWEAIVPAARPAALGRLGTALHSELQDLEPRLTACFDEVTQARHGQTPFTAVADDHVALAETGTTVLMLEVETMQDQARIVDAPVETRGGASDGLIACVQLVLRGRTFSAPGSKPGSRHRVQYPLLQ